MKNKTLAQVLHDLRMDAGLTQAQVSEYLGYSTAQFVSNWERGLSAPPVNILKRISLLYKVDAETLFQEVLKDRVAVVEKELREKFHSLKKR